MNEEMLESLCQEALDGTISRESMDLLEQELLENSASLQLYREYARLQNSLEQVHEPSAPISESSVVPVERIIHHQKRKTIKLVALATAAVVILSLAMLSIFKTAENEPALAFKVSPGTKYEMSHLGDSKDQPEGLVLEKGSSLSLSQGTVELTFKSGVRAILQAPAMVTLQDDDSLHMHEGVAWYEVPEGAEGFQVSTKDINIVDLGTEFGVIALPDDYDEVHVLKGKVKVTAKMHRKESATLTADDARRVDSIGKIVTIPSNQSAFLTQLPSTLPYIHWSFDKIVKGKFKAEGSHPDVGISDAEPSRFDLQRLSTHGRFGKAVRFTGIKGQQLYTQLPGVEGDGPRTTACWVRTSYTPKAKTGNDIAGLIGWGFCVDDNKITRSNSVWKQYISYLGSNSASGGGACRGRTKVTDGKWHHLACVMKPIAGVKGGTQVTLYVDGKIEKTYRESQLGKTDTVTQRFGSTPVRIGCSIHKPSTSPIVFRGDMDEVYLFYGALEQKDILKLMENSYSPSQ